MARIARAVAATLATGACALALGLAASADPEPSYATGAPTGSETIEGTIGALTGKYTLTLHDVRGFDDSVTLHDGTVIDPSGVALQVDDEVTITGHTDGSTFDADDINTDAGDQLQTAPAADSFYGFGGANIEAPYVIPLGNGNYYYGNGTCCFGSYYSTGPAYVIVNAPSKPKTGAPGAPIVIGRPVLQPHPPISRPRLSTSHSNGGSHH